MLIEKLNIVSEILRKHQNQIVFDGTHFVAKKDTVELEKDCISMGIKTDKFGDTLILSLSSVISSNLILYDQISTHFESNFITEEFSIIKTDGEYCYHSKEKESFFFSSNATNEFKIICQNTFSYYKLYNYLKSNEFADHHNSANKEIVFYNSEKGIFKIKYDSIPSIDKIISIKIKVEDLISTASQIEINFFFKSALISFGSGKDYISIAEILFNATDIISTTKRNYALVAKQFNFDKFRDSLYKEKEKYFTNIREIINKIYNQAIGIPVSISATVFAIYRISDDTLMFFIIWFIFNLYTAFYVIIQLNYRADIQELDIDFKKDFGIIKNKSGLPEDLIQGEKTKIERKISSSKTMIELLIVVVICLGLAINYYIFDYVCI